MDQNTADEVFEIQEKKFLDVVSVTITKIGEEKSEEAIHGILQIQSMYLNILRNYINTAVEK